ncbi:MAG: cytochrome c oxidase accessory protein CcoG, partial [Gammaproteobacteria bacterium]|nr:cytochrome c oxidase accessory protein CcoG [Gammaproteobacteria bacterium]
MQTETDTKTSRQKKSVEVEVNQSLYAKHEKVYPREVHGWFATLRFTGVLVLLGIF